MQSVDTHLSPSLVPYSSAIADHPGCQRVATGIRRLYRETNPQRQHAISFRHLAKLSPITSQHLEDLRNCFAPLCPSTFDQKNTAILGLSESGIIPSYVVQSLRPELNWHCTTRTPSNSGTSFKEVHSHAPNHYLSKAFLDLVPKTLWIVEDEITTGKTIINLLTCLPDFFRELDVLILSLLDVRSENDRSSFENSLGQLTASGKVRSVSCRAVFPA